MIDRLIDRIIACKNPSVVGLDPVLSKIPACYKTSVSSVSDIFIEFGKDIVDTVAPYVPAIKPQMAFYETYGSSGVYAFEKTVSYAKKKGLIVIEDAKRNDIGNTAKAYADGHLGKVCMPDGTFTSMYDVDFITVSPFLGSESLQPFVESCKTYQKGIFVLIKTSNVSAGEIQDQRSKDGQTISETLACNLEKIAKTYVGKHGYSAIGAVVGATYSQDAQVLRNLMPHCLFLVPGYGAQGGNADDVMPCFDNYGLGAIVNSSRGILYKHMTDYEREHCAREEYLKQVEHAVTAMQKSLCHSLCECKNNLLY